MRSIRISAALLVMTFGSGAHAGVFTDDLSRCVVEKATEADKTELVRWMFAAVTKDPALAGMANLSQAQRDKLNKAMADIYSRLILVDCRTQAVAALKNEGPSAFGESGRVLGSAAARQLFNSPSGQAELGKFGDLMDKKAWEDLGKEAGVALDKK